MVSLRAANGTWDDTVWKAAAQTNTRQEGDAEDRRSERGSKVIRRRSFDFSTLKTWHFQEK